MSTPATGSEFLELVVQSGLLTREQAEPYAGSELAYDPDAPRLLAEQLVADGLLTTFQTRQLLAGKTRGYFFADNKYKALLPRGNGTLGPIILCEDVRLHQNVAIQLLQKCPDKDSGKLGGLERFVREGLAVGTMNHPNLVRVFGMEWSGKTPFLIQENVDGTSLKQLVAEAGPPTVQQAAQWVRQAATGLQHAHAKRLIHREVSPSNLILDPNGSVRVTGFGLTHLFRTPSPGGTDPNDAVLAALADFMAPEQAAGLPGDARSDVYSLGATLYFLLTGRAPFEADGVAEKVTGHQTRPPTPVRELRADVSYGLAEVIGHMMAKNPNERYQSVGDVAVALSQWARDPAAKAAKAAGPAPGPVPAPRREPTFPPLGTVSTGSGASWGALPAPAVTGPPSVRAPGPKPAPAPRPAPLPRFDPPVESNGHAAHDPRTPLTRQPARFAAPPPQDEHGHDADEPPEFAAPPSANGSAPAVSVRAPVPAQAAAKPRKPVSAVAVGAGLLIVLLLVGGAIAVAVISSGGPAVATLPKPPPPPAGGQNSGNNDPPKPPDPVPKQPDPTPKPPDPKPKDPVQPVPANVTEIKGSGSTFIKPAMDYWTTNLYAEKTKGAVKITYVGNGSGKGIANMIDKVCDFGCTDAPMTDAELKKAKDNVGEVLHVPLALGAVVVTYNLDVKPQLVFRGEILADIYLGNITKWNDPAIALNNPGVNLPNLPITVIRREDSSGTTAIWTDYLTKASKPWADQVGTGTKVKWPVGEDAEKSDGVAKAVSRTVGSLGYVELSFALERNLKYAKIKNKLGNAIEPSLESVTAAANASLQEIKQDSDLRYSLTNPPGAESYPICGTTWMVLYLDQTGDKKKGKALVDFLKWAVTDGQPKLKDLRYAPLPASLVARVKEKIDTIQAGE
jgi:phosphate transport system substrate-binding protein